MCTVQLRSQSSGDKVDIANMMPPVLSGPFHDNRQFLPTSFSKNPIMYWIGPHWPCIVGLSGPEWGLFSLDCLGLERLSEVCKMFAYIKY